MRSIQDRWAWELDAFEVLSVAAFTAEYAARLWSSTADPRFARPVLGRLRFALTPMALVDLIAVLPSYLAFLAVDLRSVRALRLVRILRVAKLGRYSESWRLIAQTLRSKKEEMVLSFGILIVLIVIGATLMYHAEGAAQPERFPDIPSTMWWAVITLTTIGYGDVYPVTGLGRLLGGLIAILGVLTIALPTGIFAAGFAEEVARAKATREAARPPACPHCGKPIG